MNKYILYTIEGYCEDPKGNEVDNCQYLGRIEAADEGEAVEKFCEEHPNIQSRGYNPNLIVAAQLHDSEEIY